MVESVWHVPGSTVFDIRREIADFAVGERVTEARMRCEQAVLAGRNELKLRLRRAGSQQVVFVARRQAKIDRGGERIAAAVARSCTSRAAVRRPGRWRNVSRRP